MNVEFLGHTTEDQDNRLLAELDRLACPKCDHPVLRIIDDGKSETCDACGYARKAEE